MLTLELTKLVHSGAHSHTSVDINSSSCLKCYQNKIRFCSDRLLHFLPLVHFWLVRLPFFSLRIALFLFRCARSVTSPTSPSHHILLMLSAFRPVRAAARALAVQQRAIATAADSETAAAAAALCSCRTHADAAASASASSSSSSLVAAHSMCAVCARSAWRPAAVWSCAPLPPRLHMSARAFSTLRTISVRSLQPQTRAATLRITAANFSTAAPKAEQAATGAQDAGAAGAKAGAEGEGAKAEGADAGAGFSEQSSGSAPQFEEQTVKRRNWPKTIGKILLGAGAIWGIMNYCTRTSSSSGSTAGPGPERLVARHSTHFSFRISVVL